MMKNNNFASSRKGRRLRSRSGEEETELGGMSQSLIQQLFGDESNDRTHEHSTNTDFANSFIKSRTGVGNAGDDEEEEENNNVVDNELESRLVERNDSGGGNNDTTNDTTNNHSDGSVTTMALHCSDFPHIAQQQQHNTPTTDNYIYLEVRYDAVIRQGWTLVEVYRNLQDYLQTHIAPRLEGCSTHRNKDDEHTIFIRKVLFWKPERFSSCYMTDQDLLSLTLEEDGKGTTTTSTTSATMDDTMTSGRCFRTTISLELEYEGAEEMSEDLPAVMAALLTTSVDATTEIEGLIGIYNPSLGRSSFDWTRLNYMYPDNHHNVDDDETNSNVNSNSNMNNALEESLLSSTPPPTNLSLENVPFGMVGVVVTGLTVALFFVLFFLNRKLMLGGGERDRKATTTTATTKKQKKKKKKSPKRQHSRDNTTAEDGSTTVIKTVVEIEDKSRSDDSTLTP